MVLSDFGMIFLFALVGIVSLIALFFISKLLRPDRPNVEKNTPYESGEAPQGNALVAFNPRFYVTALIFVLLEVDLVLLFPWATIYLQPQLMAHTQGLWAWFSISELFIFITLFALALAYVWVKGDLDWSIPKQAKPNFLGKVPLDMYKKVNERYRKT